MLEIKELTKYYGEIKGVENVNLNIEKGEIFGFIGPNGAGKSTTIKCIMNMINKNNGNISMDGKVLDKSNYIAKEEIGYLPSEIYLYEDLTVDKMIKYSNSFYKKDCTKRANELVTKLDLDITKKIDELSFGNLKKVGIILALMHEPKLIIMDEATSGLDPLMQEMFYEILEEEKKKGTTIFFSSHNLSEIKKICDKVAIIKNGKIIKVDKVEKLTDSNFYRITVVTENIEELKKSIKDTIVEENESEVQFMFKENINELLKVLEKFNCKKILIEEPSIEEIFMHYYQNKD